MYLPDLEVARSSSLSEVTGSIGSSVLVYGDHNRTGLWVQNNSPATMAISVSHSASFSFHSALIPSYGFWEMPRPIVLDAITFCHQTATGSALITQHYR